MILPVHTGAIPLVAVGATSEGFLILLGLTLHSAGQADGREQRFVLGLQKSQAQDLCRKMDRALNELDVYEKNPPQDCN